MANDLTEKQKRFCEEYKVCKDCKERKSIFDFSRVKTAKNGTIYINARGECKKCESLRSVKRARKYRKNNKAAAAEKARIKYQKQKESGWLEKYKSLTKDKRKEYHLKYCSEKRLKDPLYRASMNLRRRLHLYLNGQLKSAPFEKLLGCNLSFLKKYISDRFTEGMSWDNYGDWHIDHIKPLSSFNLINEKEQHIACHYSNLQPLWAADNIRKGGVRREVLWKN